MQLPSSLTNGPLRYLSNRTSLPVAIIASGPSVSELDATLIPEEVLRFRMNMFLTEPFPKFGKRVDGLFWANDVDVYYELLAKSVEENAYDYKTFFTPNAIKPEAPSARPITEKCRELLQPRTDHWMIIAHEPRVVHNMLQRPLPTQAFQVLAAALVMGFRDIHLIGVDMYSDPEKRYAHDYADNIKKRMDQKHLSPGYEKSAHAQWRDLAFLDNLRKCFPAAKIHNASSVSPLRDILPDSPILHGKPIEVRAGASASMTPDTPDRTPIVSSTPSVTNFEAEAMRWKTESEALRASTSFRLGNAIVKPLHALKQPLRNTLARRTPAPKRAANPPAQTAAPAFDVLAICHETTSMTGGYRPIKSYIETTQKMGRSTKIVDLTALDPSRRGNIEWPQSHTTIINSIAPIEWKSVQDLLKSPPENTWFYLHEMGWIFEKIKKSQPDFYRRLEEAISAFPVLCVSEVQRDFIQKTFSPPYTKIVYNVAGNGNTSIKDVVPAKNDDAPIILMVGTIQKRKGPELFCALADLAKKQDLPLRFQWVGHQTEKSIELSDNVEWLGNKNAAELREIYKTASRFLLTSHDDPFPLSCIEAMSFGVPVISYRNSGVCEVIEGMPGCAVFDDRDPEHVLAVIKQALGETPEPKRLFFHARPYTSDINFVEVFDEGLRRETDDLRKSAHG